MSLSSEKGDDETVPPLPKKLCLGAAPSTANAGRERKVEATMIVPIIFANGFSAADICVWLRTMHLVGAKATVVARTARMTRNLNILQRKKIRVTGNYNRLSQENKRFK